MVGWPSKHSTGVAAPGVCDNVYVCVGSGYWLPGGGVDPGETLSAAALRCTTEPHPFTCGARALEE